MQQVCFIPVGVRTVLRILVGIKNLWQNKKLPCDKFVKKKRKFCKTFHGTQNFSELSMFVNVSLTYIFDEIGRGPGQKKRFLRYHLYRFFKKKNLLRMRIAENTYCIEKYDCVKKMTSCHFK